MTALLITLALIVIGYLFGRHAERSHFRRLREGEAELQSLLTFSDKRIPEQFQPCRVQLVGGNTVVAVDYFKTIAAALRNLFGGRVTAYESLIERARRESLLRMKREAQALGATAVFNVRLETSSITKGARDQQVSVEVYAYGTAVIPQHEPV
ncbi:YbjQ family protein [Ferrimonas balearica]|uniref:YbjQ family protein n=1 Tax=Ferrimonas balearica TaxID=44012 RepID=UPI001C998AEA|nr:YbjQ family protein [Ferrimonas balearica]MBY5991285.1 YbjQ family protein [Ferrimonas balearica]